MRVFICDDDERLMQELCAFIEGTGENDDVICFRDAESMLETAQNTVCDLAYIDIALKDDNGICAAKKLNMIVPMVKVVFMTAYVQKFVNELFMGIQPYGFISKPLDCGKVLFYLKRRRSALKESERSVLITYERKRMEILMADISHIESRKRVAHIQCVNGAAFDIYEKLSSVEKRLDMRFVRCHQSFIVNVEQIDRLENEYVIMKDGTKIGVSRSRADATKHSYLVYKGRDVL